MQQRSCTRCKVYEAEITSYPTWRFSIAVDEEGEKRLREDIWLGRKLITLGRVIAETTCARAQDIADITYA